MSSQQESNILVDAEEVLQWLGDAMERSGAASGVKSAREFLDYVGRRSGLFLPRSDKRYAFVHLSFLGIFRGSSDGAGSYGDQLGEGRTIAARTRSQHN